MKDFNILNENNEIRVLNEMIVNVKEHLPSTIENSVYYPKLRQLLFMEIAHFCKEKVELKQDLFVLKDMVGQQLDEGTIRNYLDKLKEKYNSIDNDIGIDYHIESTRIDFGVPVFVIIKRNQINMKKFVFRFRRDTGIGGSIEGLSSIGIPLE